MKNQMQQQVQAFHKLFNHPIGETPAPSRPELRARLILEEAIETAVGLVGSNDAFLLAQDELTKVIVSKDPRSADLVEATDGICDTLYVLFGTAVEYGIDIQAVFDEVHRSNMAKFGGEVRADGKSLKPVGWTAPDILGQLVAQGYKP